MAQACTLFASRQYDEAIRIAREVIVRKRDCQGAYYLLLRAMFASGRYQEIAVAADAALEASDTDYNL